MWLIQSQKVACLNHSKSTSLPPTEAQMLGFATWLRVPSFEPHAACPALRLPNTPPAHWDLNKPQPEERQLTSLVMMDGILVGG